MKTKELLRLKFETPSSYKVFFENGVLLGEIYQEIDGFYVYFSNPEKFGFWQAYVLRAIADKLDAMNEAWQKQIDEFFKETEEK